MFQLLSENRSQNMVAMPLMDTPIQTLLIHTRYYVLESDETRSSAKSTSSLFETIILYFSISQQVPINKDIIVVRDFNVSIALLT